jgi:hypothetical protein
MLKQKDSNTLVKSIEKKYGVALRHRTDSELHASLKKDGLPSLSKLLKMTKVSGQ